MAKSDGLRGAIYFSPASTISISWSTVPPLTPMPTAVAAVGSAREFRDVGEDIDPTIRALSPEPPGKNSAIAGVQEQSRAPMRNY
jgi:hypothetical protein